MTPDDERKMKEELFGRIGVANSSGPYAVDPKILLEPFEWTEGVARVFCKRCDATMEVNMNLAKKLAQKAKGNIPESFEGIYFEAGGCILCSGGYRNISLKQIPAH